MSFANVFAPNGHDLRSLRRWLDDLQLRGTTDLTVIEKWRALLDAFERIDRMRDEASEATSAIQIAVEDLEAFDADLTVNIGGTLDDLQADDGENGITQATRTVIDEKVTEASEDVVEAAKNHVTEVVKALRSGLEDLDIALSIDDQTRRDAFLAKADREKRERAAAKKAKAKS